MFVGKELLDNIVSHAKLNECDIIERKIQERARKVIKTENNKILDQIKKFWMSGDNESDRIILTMHLKEDYLSDLCFETHGRHYHIIIESMCGLKTISTQDNLYWIDKVERGGQYHWLWEYSYDEQILNEVERMVNLLNEHCKDEIYDLLLEMKFTKRCETHFDDKDVTQFERLIMPFTDMKETKSDFESISLSISTLIKLLELMTLLDCEYLYNILYRHQYNLYSEQLELGKTKLVHISPRFAKIISSMTVDDICIRIIRLNTVDASIIGVKRLSERTWMPQFGPVSVNDKTIVKDFALFLSSPVCHEFWQCVLPMIKVINYTPYI